MKSQIQILDLDTNYLADLDRADLEAIHGGGIFGDAVRAIGDVAQDIYDLGKDLGRSIGDAIFE